MRIGVVSDVHDHIDRLRTALSCLRAVGAEALICCGDLCSPFIVAELANGFRAGPTHIVFGNNDGDRYRIATIARQQGESGIEVHGESAALDFAGRRVFVHHFNDVGALIAASGQFDLVCYGHNHEWKAERHPGGSLEVNPGAVMGWHPTRGDIPATVALYDTQMDRVQIIDIDLGTVVASAE